MNPEATINHLLKFIGIFALVICFEFGFAKLTHLTMVISPTHCYFGQTSEIPPTGEAY